VKSRRIVQAIMAVLVLCLLAPAGVGAAEPADQQGPTPIVRLAELEIDPAYVDEYTAALTEEIQASIAVEPGVLTLYAVSIKEDPTRIRIFETYADKAAYNSHIQSPHFVKYKNGTQHMIRNLTLLETDPILLGTK
jgi:quinol monooxygenase YgiN